MDGGIDALFVDSEQPGALQFTSLALVATPFVHYLFQKEVGRLFFSFRTQLQVQYNFWTFQYDTISGVPATDKARQQTDVAPVFLFQLGAGYRWSTGNR